MSDSLTLVQNAILWNNASTWLNNIFETVIALGRFKKKFKEMPEAKTIQRVVERFQTAYTLKDEPRSGSPHTLSNDDRTELREHMEEHPGMSAHHAAQQLGYKRKTGRKTLKEEGFFSY